jgi:hypothetical protein
MQIKAAASSSCGVLISADEAFLLRFYALTVYWISELINIKTRSSAINGAFDFP